MVTLLLQLCEGLRLWNYSLVYCFSCHSKELSWIFKDHLQTFPCIFMIVKGLHLTCLLVVFKSLLRQWVSLETFASENG